MSTSFDIDVWGEGAFEASEGHLTMKLGAKSVDLFHLANTLRQSGKLPALLHAPELARRRATEISAAFQAAFAKSDHDGRHIALYPLKASAESELLQALSHVCDGFEVGSKPELARLLALFPEGWGLELVVGGRKDARYLELALHARDQGFFVTLVLEHPSELPGLLQVATTRDGVKLGARAALSVSGRSTWSESIGPFAKAGLTASQLFELAQTLEHHDALRHLDLLHIHTGSQLDDREALEGACREAARLALGLRELGAPITRLDIGGGLPAPYSRVELDAAQHAEMVTSVVTEVFHDGSRRAPDIVTEFGRAVAAPSSMLLFEVTHAHASRPTGNTIADAHAAFRRGEVDLETLAEHEREASERGPQIYSGALSVFRSAPDAWALQQHFPLTPLHRLNEPPSVDAIVSDATCDSHGRLHGRGPHASHRLHPLHEGEPYLLALPLVGAYQQALGSAHNLFGEPTEVLVEADGTWNITRDIPAEDSTYPLQD